MDNATGQRMVSGISCDGENAFTEFLTTKQAYHKTGGINFYHYVQSFSPDENITPQEVHAVAREFAERAWPGHEILVATHCDTDHLHSHFVINSVSFENGKKLRQNPNTLKELRALNDEICVAHGLFVLPPYEKSGKKLSSREYRAAIKGESWKFKLMANICAAMNRSGSKQDFIVEMERCGYQVKWTDERKHITFTCPNRMKCRDIKLHDHKYLKENLEYELQYREAHYGRAGRKKRKRYSQYERVELASDGADSGEKLGYKGKSTGEYGEFPTETVLAGETAVDRGADDFPVVGEADKGFYSADGEPQQAGKNLEKSLNASLAKGSQLETAIAKAAKRRSWKTWALIIAVSILSSALGAALSALL